MAVEFPPSIPELVFENILLKEDLNELFVALNNLSEKEEIKIPLLEKNKQNNEVTISVDKAHNNAIILTPSNCKFIISPLSEAAEAIKLNLTSATAPFKDCLSIIMVWS